MEHEPLDLVEDELGEPVEHPDGLDVESPEVEVLPRPRQLVVVVAAGLQSLNELVEVDHAHLELRDLVHALDVVEQRLQSLLEGGRGEGRILLEVLGRVDVLLLHEGEELLETEHFDLRLLEGELTRTRMVHLQELTEVHQFRRQERGHLLQLWIGCILLICILFGFG